MPKVSVYYRGIQEPRLVYACLREEVLGLKVLEKHLNFLIR